MGRWSFLRGQVPERPNEEPGYAERYAEFKKACGALTFEGLASRLTQNIEAKGEFEKDLKDVNLNIKVLERLMIEKQEAEGLESVVAGGYRWTPSPEPSFSKRDGRALRKWADETGQSDLLTINSQTLSSIAKDYFLEHAEAPPGVELTGTYTKLSRTKRK